MRIWSLAELRAAPDTAASFDIFLKHRRGGVGDEIVRALSGFSKLRTLRMAEATRLTDEGVAGLAESHPKLSGLGLHVTPKLTDAALANLAALPLTALELAECQELSGKGLMALADCPIQTLHVRDCAGLKGASMAEFIGELKELRHLCLEEQPCTASVFEAAASLPKLQEIRIIDEDGRTRRGAFGRLSETDSLRRLRVDRPLSGREAQALSGLTGLERVQIRLDEKDDIGSLDSLADLPLALSFSDANRVDDELLVELVDTLPGIVELDLDAGSYSSRAQNFGGEGVTAVAGLKKLRWLSLRRNYTLQHKDVDALAGHDKLEVLNLRGCRRLTPDVIETLQQLTGLRRLDVTAVQLSDADTGPLAKLPLEAIALGESRRVGDGTLRHLASAKGLHTVQCTQAVGDVTDFGVEALAQLPELHTLELDLAQLGSPGLAAFKKMKKLRRLHLRSRSRVTPQWLDSFGQLPELKALSFSEHSDTARLTEASIEKLAKASSLRRFSLHMDEVGPGFKQRIAAVHGLRLYTEGEELFHVESCPPLYDTPPIDWS